MTNNTPINPTNESYATIVARHLLAALRFVEENDKVDIALYHQQNHATADRLAQGWVTCKGDSPESYARAICYSNLNVKYDINHFDQIVELHYQHMRDKWLAIVSYTNRSLSGLL